MYSGGNDSLNHDAIVTFLSDMLREYKLQNKEWDRAHRSIDRRRTAMRLY